MSKIDYILEVKNLEKKYELSSESLVVFSGLNLCVKEGEKCVIIGRSGSGKSTLLNIIGGLDSSSSGDVLIDGNNLNLMKEKDLAEFRKNDLGFVFQFHHLLKDFTALENVFLPAIMAGHSRKTAENRARILLEEVGLADRMNHLPSELSGGERQRVAVARSLVNDPKIILADEPTGNLDPANANVIGDMLFSLSETHRKTLVLVTHDMKLASRGSRVYSLENGKLSEASV